MRIAVVGAGISGIMSAYLLDREHEVTLYEGRDRLGGHTNTVDVNLDGRTESVDTGFIVYNERNYPSFVRFLSELGVETQPAPMSFSFRDEESGLEYGGGGLSEFFSQRNNLLSWKHWKMFFEVIYFYSRATSEAERLHDLTLREYLDGHSYSERFMNEHLIPMVAAIWSVPKETAGEFPFGYVVDFFQHHGLLDLAGRPQWRTITGGSRQYIDRFKEVFDGKILVDSPVDYVERTSESIDVLTAENRTSFDRVIMGVHSDQALDMLKSPSDLETDLLGSIPYESNDVVLHTDESVLPDNPDIWSSWNYHSFKEDVAKSTVTYDLSILQNLGFESEICETLNATGRIDSDKIIDEFEYSHPVFTQEAVRARNRLDEIDDRGGVYFAGAYRGNGFHEDGVSSAISVAEKLGVNW